MIQKKLHELFVHYSKSLPERIHSLELKWQAQLKHWDLAGFQDFHRNVHSLCGSAGTYGYFELSKIARALEILLKTILVQEHLTHENQEEINYFFSELKSVLAHEIPKAQPFFASEPRSSDNKLIYLLECDRGLVAELNESLEQASYNPHYIKDMESLKLVVEEQQPMAIIINTEYLDQAAIDFFLLIQKQQKAPVHVFCIVPNADLLPRLAAIRAGCIAFFQKPLDVSYLIQELNINCSLSNDKSHRILILDDSKSLAEYYSLILKQANMITRAITNPFELLKELETFQPDLLLMDVYMPECSGLELAVLLRKDRKYTKIPIIFLSTEDDKNKKLSAISLGGDDFLTKPISPRDLVLAVQSRSNRASILNYYMISDSLTGLLNHSSILNRFTVEVARAKQQSSPLSFVMIDIDNFKLINDNYGHPFGDAVIKKLASLLMVNLRSRDIIGRYGGEEFALILPGATLENSGKICNHLRRLFSQSCFTIDDQTVFVTLSAGVASFDGTNDANSIVIQADNALYKAKHSGRDQVVLYTDTDSTDDERFMD